MHRVMRSPLTASRFSVLFALLCLFWTGLFSQIAFYGDTRSNPDIHQAVIQAMAAHKPELVFHTGDLNSKGLQQSEYNQFFEIIKPLLPSGCIFPARGNHEKDLNLFMENFPAIGSKSFYSFSFDGIRYIILDSVENLKPGSNQFLWLQNQLSDKTPSIIVLHHPIFSSGEHGDELGLQLFLPQLLKNSGVKAVFSGHDHNYERLEVDGISYIVTGGGGAPLRDIKEASPHSIFFARQHHYIIAERHDTEMTFKVFNLQGEILDSFSIKGL